VGRSFANLHIKSGNFEKAVEALKKLSEERAEVLGYSSTQNEAAADVSERSVGEWKSNQPDTEAQKPKVVMHISKSNDNWISVLHDYFVWGTVKKIGKALSQLIEEPVMTAGYINEEIFELSFYENGEIQAEKIFCEPWTRDEYGLKEERLHDDYMREALGMRVEDFDSFIKLTSPEQAADKLSQLTGIPIWSDSEWLPYEEKLRDQFGQYEFRIENA
jgi:hypothetical protein